MEIPLQSTVEDEEECQVGLRAFSCGELLMLHLLIRLRVAPRDGRSTNYKQLLWGSRLPALSGLWAGRHADIKLKHPAISPSSPASVDSGFCTQRLCISVWRVILVYLQEEKNMDTMDKWTYYIILNNNNWIILNEKCAVFSSLGWSSSTFSSRISSVVLLNYNNYINSIYTTFTTTTATAIQWL